MGPERKLYQKLKKNFTDISLIRLENNSLLGTPDILACNSSGHFFTIELKVTSGNRLKFSPHQIAFHVKHPRNTFILVFDASCKLPKLYEGKRIRNLVARGLKQTPKVSGFKEIKNFLSTLGA